jgi:hypothetical protein
MNEKCLEQLPHQGSSPVPPLPETGKGKIATPTGAPARQPQNVRKAKKGTECIIFRPIFRITDLT